MGNQTIFYPGALEQRDGELVQIGKKCKSCGKISFPVSELCRFCSSEDGEKVSLSKYGTLFSYTVTRVPVGPYKPPILAGYIDLPEGIRIFGQIHADVEQITIGLQLRMQTGVIYTEKNGIEIVGYYYVPCTTECGGAK